MQADRVTLLPYSLIVGQEQPKQALELSYVAPRIGGVLIRGDRGTGKSTAVRSFAQMVYGKLPVTLPINATDDRVVGGWAIDQLMVKRTPVRQPGLLEEANKSVLYIDEVNLLEDHIVNLILDVASTGQLSVQYESQDENRQISFVLVGTMNPEEGFLRPQLLDRFGLMVDVAAQADQRAEILRTVLAFDEALAGATDGAQWLKDGDRLMRPRASAARSPRAALRRCDRARHRRPLRMPGLRIRRRRASWRLRRGPRRPRTGGPRRFGERHLRARGERRADGTAAPPRRNRRDRSGRMDR